MHTMHPKGELMEIPEMYHIRRTFVDDSILDPESDVFEKIAACGLDIKNGDRIAVTVGSRGIADLQALVRGSVRALRDLGAKPFIIPAMGSHGGGTAEGQEEVIAGYGITEKEVGAPVISSMDVVELDAPDLENRVYMDKHAWESDGVLLINRVKPHTDFHGRWESGLLKMSVIGLGKHRLASEIHSYNIRGLKELIEPTARFLIGTGKIKGGVAVVENSYDKICLVEVAAPDNIPDTDARLLEIAREKMPRLPFSEIDVLIIDFMGKDISGCGIDTNVIGRLGIAGEEEPEEPKIGSILVTDLTDASHGNAIGVGLADVTTRRLFEKIDFNASKENVVTSSFLGRGKIPVIADTDMEGIHIALRAAGCRNIKEARICRIHSTLELSDMLVSPALRSAVAGFESTEVLMDTHALADKDGNLVKFPGS